MGLFSKKPTYCIICNKELTHKHKPKKEWNIKGTLCGDCHFDKSKEYYEGKIKQPCVICKTSKIISELWEPRWQWDMEGLLCKECFDKKEQNFAVKKNFCALCGTKMGLMRHNPKPKWKIEGQLCRKCWDEKKVEIG
ncbi:MAG: hypothetical protein HW410_244 [Nitrosarchaeum sp.]|jgi:hypothetical protein|nr:hypothetical protein [Nitrosarchaeum sp.]